MKCHVTPEAPQKPSYKKGYLTLAGVFAAIVLFVAVRRTLEGDWSSRETMADFMGAFFLVFGMFKLLDWNAFADAYAMYDLLAARSRLYARAYPLVQIALGAAYLSRFVLGFVSAVALGLMAVSAAGVLRALLSRQKIQCACLGTRIELPMTTISLIEDALMAAMAAAMIFPGWA